MHSDNSNKEPFTVADKQLLVERINELETENTYLKTNIEILQTDKSALEDEISKNNSTPEFNAGYDEEVSKIHKPPRE